jgi:hypothetical protein
MAKKKEERQEFKLVIPLDASQVEGFEPEQAVKVAVQGRDAALRVEIVKLNRKGQGTAEFAFEGRPSSLKVIVGPETAEDDDLPGLQTITRELSARAWGEAQEHILAPILIPAFYWYWWLRWCRTFTIRGRLVCPDGSPVPGAKVCAYDVDWFWWWFSLELVGCDVTDANGVFEIKFRWCCGWWPWWWWRLRNWQLEPLLAERIMPVLQRELDPGLIPTPGPQPDPAVFERILTEGDMPAREPEKHLNPARLDALRQPLLDRLVPVPELEQLHIWPWWPWHPWWDCTPDIIFKVTQNCFGAQKVIVDETVFQTRWNIPQSLSVTLVANDEACCLQDGDDRPEGDCMLITNACDDPIYTIGGNPGAAASPAGYRNPGLIATHGDRPYGGVVRISGIFGDAASVDYYEFEWSSDGGASWSAMPVPAAGGFGRSYWGPKLGTTDPPTNHGVDFLFSTIDGRNVIESREHFEATNDPASWGTTRFWFSNNYFLLMRWLTENTFADDTYMLRVRSWDLVGGNLANPRILPLCDTQDDNGIVLTIDNRITGSGSGHPTAPDHPCGSGTVHICTTEPDTDIIDVRIVRSGVALPSVEACDETTLEDGDILRVDFLAHDPDGHLAYYALNAHYGENLYTNLLALGGTLTPLVGAIVPPAAQVGRTYGLARLQGATAPTWAGGAIRLEVDAKMAFKKTCCYLLRLQAYKRTIYSCNDNYHDRNRSEYSFMVNV